MEFFKGLESAARAKNAVEQIKTEKKQNRVFLIFLMPNKSRLRRKAEQNIFRIFQKKRKEGLPPFFLTF